MKIIRTDKETGQAEIIDHYEAEEKLSSYWKKGHILPMLQEGQELFTPYATYKKQQNDKARIIKTNRN